MSKDNGNLWKGAFCVPREPNHTKIPRLLEYFIEDFIESFNFCPEPCFETSLKICVNFVKILNEKNNFNFNYLSNINNKRLC